VCPTHFWNSSIVLTRTEPMKVACSPHFWASFSPRLSSLSARNSIGQAEHMDRAGLRAHGHVRAAWADQGTVNRNGKSRLALHSLGLRVPEEQRPLAARRDQLLAVGTEGHGCGAAARALGAVEMMARFLGWVPGSHQAACSSRDQFLAIGCK